MKRQTNQHRRRINFFSWAWLVGCCLLAAGVLFYGGGDAANDSARATNTPSQQVSQVRLPLADGVGHRNIEDIRVGQRVYAHNPEVRDTERTSWHEPDWSRWFHLSLTMPKQDGSELKIELLRPEQWVRSQIGFVVDEKAASTKPAEDAPKPQDETSPDSPTVTAVASGSASVPLSPLRPLYRDLALTSAALDLANVELRGLTVEMDLPEMGAIGTAIITKLRPCPHISPGPGRPVTATFSHPPSTQVLDVYFAGQSDPIGVTDNHLFWSVDRQQFLAIGKMNLGEQVQTFQGDTKRIEQKLPRPGPQTVYNLEVYGEHVYFVGGQGLLVHNSCGTRGPSRIFDNDVLVAASNNPTSNKGIVALRELAASDAFITPNQLREFTAFRGISASQLRARKAFLRTHNISVLNGKTLSQGTDFKAAFKSIVGHQGRGDAALAAFARETGFEALTFEKRLHNFIIHTLRDSTIPLRRLSSTP